MKLSEKILFCRRKAMLSQEALAERIGVSRQAISKWETGEAMPEVNKLLQLAQTFGVTTDWLLSEDEPQAEPQKQPEPQPDVSSPQPSLYDGWQKPQSDGTRTWVDAVPGVLGNLLRKYGWLFGVRLAVSGALFLAFGIFTGLVSNSFFSGMGSTSMYMPGGYMGSFGGSDLFFGDEFSSINRTGSNMFGLFSGFITLLGVVQLIAGVVLAVVLKKQDRQR